MPNILFPAFPPGGVRSELGLRGRLDMDDVVLVVPITPLEFAIALATRGAVLRGPAAYDSGSSSGGLCPSAV